MSDLLSSLAYFYGKPVCRGKLKLKPEHFQVSENLGFDFTGSGEHLIVRIRKSGENTSFVANELAKACGVKSKDVGWAGLKDRHAVTEQWLSVHLPSGETPDFSHFLAQYPNIEILAITRHNKKLRPGDLQGNHFVITLAELTEVDEVISRLKLIATGGVPNYFGQQRFGNQGNNLDEARRWGRDNVRTRNQNKRSLYLSTARSWIFNTIVSDRIEKGLFSQPLTGDIVNEGAEQHVVDSQNQARLAQLVSAGKAQLTAALAGDNALPTRDDALILEQAHLDAEPDLMALIRGNRMRHDRRNIALMPQNLTWQVNDNQVTLSFSLESGSFATSIIRELIEEIAVERHYQ